MTARRSLALRTVTAWAAALRAAVAAALATFGTLVSGERFSRSLRHLAAFAGKHITLINPDFDTDHTKRGVRLCQTIINVSAQRVQRNFPPDFVLCAINFCPSNRSFTHHTK